MPTIPLFLLASIALTLAPGPDNVFVVTQGLARGRRAAIVTALGMCSGISVHTLAASAGISALFYSSAVAFQAVKYAGAAYLLYLAYRAVRERGSLAAAVANDAGPGDLALFRRGFLMNVLNPKVALFFLAFLPQFTDPAAGGVGWQMTALGMLFMLQATVIFSAIGYFSGSIGQRLLGRPHLVRGFAWLAAAIFASLGVKLALAER